jgi:hypothetical protein
VTVEKDLPGVALGPRHGQQRGPDSEATVVEGPLKGQLCRIRLSETKLPKEEVGKIVRQMQSESNVVNFIATKE